MSDFQLTRSRGESIKFTVGPITRAAGDVNLTAAGTRVTVTGKVRSDDAVPVFVKDYYQAGGAPHGGVTITPNTIDSVDVIVPGNEPGVLALTRPTYVQVDVLLEEADGTATIVARGVIKIRLTPSR